MPNYTEAQQRVIDDVQRRREEREARQHRADLTAIQARQREGRNTSARRSVVQTPRGSSYIDLEGSTFADYPVANRYIISASQNRPIHADFESSYQYNVFLQSKYKHHHKCGTCQRVFRCGQIKCTRTLCRTCSVAAEVTAPWTTGVVSLNFNGSIGSTWQNNYVTVDEAAQWPDALVESVATADYEAAERRILANLVPERNTPCEHGIHPEDCGSCNSDVVEWGAAAQA